MPHFQDGGYVIYEDNGEAKILSARDIGTKFSKIHNVLDDGAKYNYWAVVNFMTEEQSYLWIQYMFIRSARDNKLLFVTNRNINVYTMHFDDLNKYDSWLAIKACACKY